MSDDTLSKLWQAITGMINQPASQYPLRFIPQERSDVAGQPITFEPFASYFRLWLCDMYLKNQRVWFTTWFPAVQSSVQLQFGQNNAEFSRISCPPKDKLGPGVRLNYTLTELLPYNGGTVTVEAALLGLQGKDYFGAAIKVLQDFTSLVTPPLGQVLNVADKVNAGVRSLLGATDGQLHLGFHQTFSDPGDQGGNVFKPGYYAVVLATANELESTLLSVQSDKLYWSQTAGATPVPLEGYDYMLFRVEGLRERPDWRLKNIVEPLTKAKTALIQSRIDPAKAKEAEAFKTAVLIAVTESPDLAELDKRRVIDAIEKDLEQYASPAKMAVAESGKEDFAAILTDSRRAMSREEAKNRGPLILAELLEG